VVTNSENIVSPKQTFFNLPEKKREKIIRAAVEEFAANGYKRASLNTIVREAGIAKGSLYQYFEHKEALFLYLFGRFTLLVKQAVKMAEGASQRQDFFATARDVIRAGFFFIDRYPEYFALYCKVLFEHDIPCRDDLIRKVRLFSTEYFAPLCEAARKNGAIRHDLPTNVIVFVLDAVIDRMLMAYAKSYLAGGGLDFSARHARNQAVVDAVFDAIRNGVVASFAGEEK
jgi:AcrR family transcriptional regulator